MQYRYVPQFFFVGDVTDAIKKQQKQIEDLKTIISEQQKQIYQLLNH